MGTNDYYTSSAVIIDTARFIFGQPTYIFSLDFKSLFNLLTDVSFDGKEASWNVHDNINQSQQGKYMVFSLHHISSSFYKYSLSARRYDDAEDNPFAEPVILYSKCKKRLRSIQYGINAQIHHPGAVILFFPFSSVI